MTARPGSFLDAWRHLRARLGLTPRTQRQRRGQRAERHAARHLRRQGLKIVARNWQQGHAELDLVCRDGPQWVFVEVRARQHGAAVSGAHTLTQGKRQALRRAIRAYLSQLGPVEPPWRCDVVSIALAGNRPVALDHHEGVPL